MVLGSQSLEDEALRQERVINILVRAPNWLGDVMMCTPALTSLRKTYPKANISVLVKKELKEALAGNPDISEIITFPSGAPFFKRVQFYLSLRVKKIDLAILFTNSFESALCAYLASARQRVGYNRDFRRLFLTDPVCTPSRLPPRIHQSDYYLNLVRKKGEPSRKGTVRNLDKTEGEKELIFFIPDADRNEVKKVWEQEGLTKAPLVIGFGPGAAFGNAKRWPPFRYALLGDKIVQKLGGRVVLFGSGVDDGVCENIIGLMNEKALSLAGKSSIKGLGAFLEKCDAYVTNDSGPMHIAASLKTPVVAIFGSTDQAESAPLSPLSTVVTAGASCSPCWKRECPSDHTCMESISADEVFTALQKILPKKK
ncbi:MAG: lipopolysaccharide heptosyltransferase II [Nitrospinota bacterium]